MRILRRKHVIWLGLLALFCAPGEVAAGEGADNESALPKIEIEWPVFLARHDMLWTKLPQNWREAPWTG